MYQMYSIYDKLGRIYGFPFAQLNDDTACRYFAHLVQKNEFAQPSDFELYKVGSFVSETCEIQLLAKPELVMRGDD